MSSQNRKNKDFKEYYFDDDGYPVYVDDLKRMRQEKEERENGV